MITAIISLIYKREKKLFIRFIFISSRQTFQTDHSLKKVEISIKTALLIKKYLIIKNVDWSVNISLLIIRPNTDKKI